jgi:putative MATE family efflux protein
MKPAPSPSSFSVVHSNSITRSLRRLALPVFLEELLTLTVGWTDWWLAGNYVKDESALVAMSLMAYVMWLLPNMFAAISIGATALVARSVGAHDYHQANRAAHQAIGLGIILAAIATLIIFLVRQRGLEMMNMKGESLRFATSYLSVVMWVIPLIMFEQVGAACLRGAGDTVTGLVAKSIVNVINIVVSAGLVAGLWGFPKLGFVGLAIGTACGHGVGGLLILGILLVGRAGLRLPLRSFLAVDTQMVSRLLRIGIPGGADIAVLLVCQFIFLRIVYELGDSAAAAHGLAIQIEALAYLPGTAFQVAAATMSGQFLGAKDPSRAVRSVLVICGFGATFMSLTGAFFWFFGSRIASLFLDVEAQQTTQIASELLKIIAFAMPFLACLMIVSGALRGAGDTRVPMLITIFGFLVVRLPLTLWLALPSEHPEQNLLGISGWGWGIHGAWYAMTTDLTIRCLLSFTRLMHGGWLKKHV